MSRFRTSCRANSFKGLVYEDVGAALGIMLSCLSAVARYTYKARQIDYHKRRTLILVVSRRHSDVKVSEGP